VQTEHVRVRVRVPSPGDSVATKTVRVAVWDTWAGQ
jgi:hypothetical protein